MSRFGIGTGLAGIARTFRPPEAKAAGLHPLSLLKQVGWHGIAMLPGKAHGVAVGDGFLASRRGWLGTGGLAAASPYMVLSNGINAHQGSNLCRGGGFLEECRVSRSVGPGKAPGITGPVSGGFLDA